MGMTKVLMVGFKRGVSRAYSNFYYSSNYTKAKLRTMVGAASLSASTHQFDLWNSKNLAAISYFVFILFTI